MSSVQNTQLSDYLQADAAAGQPESLSLVNDCNLHDTYLKNLRQITHLGLYDCNIINQRCFMEARDSLKTLRSLDIRGIDALNPEFYKTLAKHCPRIEVLKMSCPKFSCNRVALMPKLKHLELLHRCKNESLSVIAALAQLKANYLEGLVISSGKFLTLQHIEQISKLKKLKTLSITCNDKTINDEGLVKFGKLKELEELTISACKHVTNKGLVYLMRSCPKLQTVYMEYCERVSGDFIKEAVEIARGDKRKFTFYAHATAVDEFDRLQSFATDSLINIDLRFTGHNLEM
ncbi:F-box/LRR-repeat protein 4-like [Ceratitis capitata]|uniref:F-box/LRR-repeat protein 4-like n=1 Tax=Ceratitis capitata TaxID=7213 RepID=UPI000329C36E|nr:F-box/LRR-repeat protein 4-like [Ceratitis capitata]